MIEPILAFSMFQSLKFYFSGDFDYFKYGMATFAKKSNVLDKRRDKWKFVKLSKMYNSVDELQDYLVANFINKDVKWVQDVLEPDSTEIYKEWNKRIQGFSYFFGEDIKKLREPFTKTNYPKVVQMYLWKDISIETVVAINSVTPLVELWFNSDDMVLENLAKKINKYSPFFLKHVDQATINQVMVSTVKKMKNA